MSGLLRSNLVVATGTALSRVSGLARVLALAYVIGQNSVTDAYKFANETPNIVYDLLLGGVLSATLVPLFTSFIGADDGRDDDRATSIVMTTAATLMVALTAIAVFAAPLVFSLYSFSTAAGVDGARFREAGTVLTRIFLVQILFYGLTGLANAYLNSRRRFLAAAWSPIAPNLVIVATLLSLPDPGPEGWRLSDVVADDRLRLTLGFGATIGIASMAAIVLPAAVRCGLDLRPVWDWRHPAVRKLLRLSGWTFGFVVANQVAVVAIRNLALSEGPGLGSAYIDAFTWFVLPHGLLAVSVATTFQPELARAVANRDRAAFVHHTSLGVRIIAGLTLPAAAVMFVLREPIIGVMQQRGAFDAAARVNTADALGGLAIGLAGFSVYLFVLRGFYAHQDTRTPFVLNVGENLLNIVLAVAFIRWWGVFGIALAHSLAYLVAAVWALRVVARRVQQFPLGPIWSSVWRMLLATALAAQSIWFLTRDVDQDTGWQAVAQITVGGGVGIVVYVAALVVLRAPEIQWMRQRLTRS